MAVRAVIFDFDGLLMDTESTSLASWQQEYRRHGLVLDLRTFFADHGGDVTEERYASLAAAVGPAFDRAGSHASRLAYRALLNSGLQLAAGIWQWLDEAADLEIRLAVASSSPSDWVSGHLSRVGALSRFEQLACGDEVSQPKPDPAVYELALRRLQLPPGSAVAVEDTPHGITAAQAAGLRCIAIPNPHADPERFTAAEVLLSSAAEVALGEVITRLADAA